MADLLKQIESLTEEVFLLKTKLKQYESFRLAPNYEREKFIEQQRWYADLDKKRDSYILLLIKRLEGINEKSNQDSISQIIEDMRKLLVG